MRRLRDRVAGLDVHRDTVVAAVTIRARGREPVEDVRTFSTVQAGFVAMTGWLLDYRVELVAMEATGVYWKPVYYSLEDGFEELWLCNPHHVKNVPGRKTDINDAQWLADVAAHGMVRPSLVPPAPVRALRDLTRYRKSLIRMRAAEIQRLEKVFQDAGIKLTSVASGVWSQSSQQMLAALIAGQSDPVVLAEMAKGTMRAKIPQLRDALAGNFGAHHAAIAGEIADHIRDLDARIERLTAEIVERTVPFDTQITILTSMPGIDRRAAEVIIAEIGGDISKFDTPGQLCAWAGLAPGNNQSGGKRRAAPTRKGSQHLKTAMIEAAHSAARTKTSYYHAQKLRLTKRRGAGKAIVAVAHSMLETIWYLLTDGTLFDDPGADYFTRRLDPELEKKRLQRRLEALGCRVTIEPAA
jgi:transposase